MPRPYQGSIKGQLVAAFILSMHRFTALLAMQVVDIALLSIGTSLDV